MIVDGVGRGGEEEGGWVVGWRGQCGHCYDGCHLSAVMVCVMLGVSVPAVAGGDIRFLLGLYFFLFLISSFGKGNITSCEESKETRARDI